MPFDAPREPEYTPCAGCGDTGLRTISMKDCAIDLPEGCTFVRGSFTTTCGCAIGKTLRAKMYPQDKSI